VQIGNLHMTYSKGMPADQPAPLAVFLDRDGTLIENRHYLASPEGVALLPGVREAVARMRAAGARLFLFTNQSGIGRGYFTLADVEAQHHRLAELLGLGADVFAGICVAPERPDEPPVYRKPSPRFIHEMLAAHDLAAEAAWMVGDSPVDWEAGLNAGIRVAAIVADPAADPHSERRRELGVEAYASLLDWARTAFP
jgi:D-glycero-D-manno-heptose 1,7-bisphosphate phosphatase